MTVEPWAAVLEALTVMVTEPLTGRVEEDNLAVTPVGTLKVLMLMAEVAEGQVRATEVVPPGATEIEDGLDTILQLDVTLTARFMEAVWTVEPLVAVTLKL